MIKKVISILLALSLAASLTISAFAEETDTTESSETTSATVETEAVTEPISEPPATHTPEEGTEETESTESTTEPAVSTDPTTGTPPISQTIPTTLEIDTKHIYEGMRHAYEEGYVPITDGSNMYMVLPLLPTGQIRGNEIKVSLDLGAGGAAPFQIAAYEKIFTLESIVPKNSHEPKELFLVAFNIKLSAERRDGVYPVVVKASGYDELGNPIERMYTIHVTITDGKTEKPVTPVQTGPETPTAEPVVYISKSVILPAQPMAGEEFTLTVTLKNSLTTKSVKNMLVTVNTGNNQISLMEDSNIFPVEKIKAGGEEVLTLRLKTDSSLPAGKYTISFSFQYDSSKSLKLSSTGTAVVEIKQPANMELVTPRFAESVTVGETIPLSLQVMNMGRDPMFNVRCVVSGYGLSPSNTGYIGQMEAGSSAMAAIDIYIIALNASAGNESGMQYGDTTGTITLYFEDESGTEYQQETEFTTTVNRPIMEVPQTAQAEEKKEEAASQWWVSVLILACLILAAYLWTVLLKIKKGRGRNYL